MVGCILFVVGYVNKKDPGVYGNVMVLLLLWVKGPHNVCTFPFSCTCLRVTGESFVRKDEKKNREEGCEWNFHDTLLDPDPFQLNNQSLLPSPTQSGNNTGSRRSKRYIR